MSQLLPCAMVATVCHGNHIFDILYETGINKENLVQYLERRGENSNESNVWAAEALFWVGEVSTLKSSESSQY